jgi:hypothetical protein
MNTFPQQYAIRLTPIAAACAALVFAPPPGASRSRPAAARPPAPTRRTCRPSS